MPRYIISFDDGWMDHIPAEELDAVSEASHKVVRDAKAKGVWIFGGGLRTQTPVHIERDGTRTEGTSPTEKNYVGGFSIIEVDSLDDAVLWATRIAEACQCPQEIREIMYDPES